MSFLIALKAFFKCLIDPEFCQKIFKNEEEGKQEKGIEHSHLKLLSLFQESSRLIDFLKEDLSSFDDAQIGMAARKIHQDCEKCLEEMVTIRPLMEEREGAIITVPNGYDPLKIKVIGKVKGSPPYTGILVHKGWKAHKRSLPKKIGDLATDIICPAEIEIR